MGRDNHFVREWGWVRANYMGFYSKVMSRGKERRAYTLSPFCVCVCVCVLEARSGVRSEIEK